MCALTNREVLALVKSLQTVPLQSIMYKLDEYFIVTDWKGTTDI